MSCGNPHETPCSQVLEHLFEYLDGELGEPDLHLVQEHLDECGPCMSERDVDHMVKSLIRRSGGGETAPGALRDRIVVQITQQVSRHPGPEGTEVTHVTTQVTTTQIAR
ncbi:MAG TPA: mycothiol system anti-sigma-R factor [Kineosporiaceae bacterium]|jgi:mycothiol system anti-sigma-R factor|nr:mycothiol system anti-sigma-R factor [Kineosporiaceae bacterium]